MADEKSSKSDGISSSVSLGISILALLISAGGLYWQFFRGPRIRAYQPNVVYVGRSQLGIPVAFTNEGTAAGVVVSGSLDLTPRAPGFNQEIPLYWTSPFEEKDSYDPNQQGEKSAKEKFTKEKVDYILFSHLPVKAGDTDAEIFWFDPRTDLGLKAGSYHACGRFRTADRVTVPAATKAASKGCSFSVDFHLDSDLSSLLHDEVTVPVKQ